MKPSNLVVSLNDMVFAEGMWFSGHTAFVLDIRV